MNPLWLLGLIAAPLEAEPKGPPPVIYGQDDRLDLYQVRDPRILRWADSTVALFQADALTQKPDGAWGFTATRYGDARFLCQKERFYQQPSASYCSGALVGPALVLTAGHCVPSQTVCDGLRFVFGFHVKRAGEYPTEFPSSEVYRCAELIDHAFSEVQSADWALVRLDRRVQGRESLSTNLGGVVPDDARLVVIGHPSGLPAKVAENGTVRVARPGYGISSYFLADVDAFHGNSGSPVINRDTGWIEGIISFSYDNDYEFDEYRECYAAKVYGPGEGSGIGVNRASTVSALWPQSPPWPHRGPW